MGSVFIKLKKGPWTLVNLLNSRKNSHKAFEHEENNDRILITYLQYKFMQNKHNKK